MTFSTEPGLVPEAPRVPTLADAVEATLLFHSSSPWSLDKMAAWEYITGTTEATTRTLCDCCRSALEAHIKSEVEGAK